MGPNTCVVALFQRAVRRHQCWREQSRRRRVQAPCRTYLWEGPGRLEDLPSNASQGPGSASEDLPSNASRALCSDTELTETGSNVSSIRSVAVDAVPALSAGFGCPGRKPGFVCVHVEPLPRGLPVCAVGHVMVAFPLGMAATVRAWLRRGGVSRLAS